jgi:hypothetical protein
MMIRPYKPRDSARSIRALPCTPEGYYTALRPLTGKAKYAWGARVLSLNRAIIQTYMLGAICAPAQSANCDSQSAD